MKRQYETTIVIDAHLSGEQVDTTISKYSKFIEDNKGKIKLIDRWGKRRLAYEIAKKQYGYYVYLRFEADGSFIKELEKEFKLDDTILRFLTVLVPMIVQKEEQAPRSRKTPEKRPEKVPEDIASSDESSPIETDVEPKKDGQQGDMFENENVNSDV